MAPGSVNASSLVQGPQQSGHPCPSQSLLTLVSVALTMSPDHLVSLTASSLLSICSLEGKLPAGRDVAVHLLNGAQMAYAHISCLHRLPPWMACSITHVNCGPGANWTKNHIPRQTLTSGLPLESKSLPTSPRGHLVQDSGDGQILPLSLSVMCLGEPET